MNRITIALLMLTAACGGGIDQKSKDPVVVINNGDTSDMGMGTNNGGGEDMSVMIPDAMSTPGGPKIIELSSNVTRLTEGQSVTISALVTDDDGLDDIVGGRVLNGETTYGNFQGSGGSYEFSLSWDTLNQVAPINFASQSTVVLTAEFVDTMGNRGTQSLTLTLHCDGQGACDGSCSALLCDGSCRDTSYFDFDDNNCGTCGNACGDGYCDGGTCFCDGDYCGGDCVDTNSDRNHCGDCNNTCGSGESCVEGFCDIAPGGMSPCFDNEDCPSGGFCITDIPGGVCIVQCESAADCGPDEGCGTPMGFPIGAVCAPRCTRDSDCREGLVCQTSAEGEMGCGPPIGDN